MVSDIAARTSDPLEACKIIVGTAYNMWLQYEVRTDDITIIAFYLDHEVVQPPVHASSPSAAPTNEINEEKPVRRALSREKKKNIIHSHSQDDADDETDVESLAISKSEEDKVAINIAIKSNFLFQHLNSSQRQTVIDLMQPIYVSPGHWVIKQGDQGDRFYVVDSGRYEVRVRPAGGPEDPSGGSVVHVYEGSADQHPGFGELSLM